MNGGTIKHVVTFISGLTAGLVAAVAMGFWSGDVSARLGAHEALAMHGGANTALDRVEQKVTDIQIDVAYLRAQVERDRTHGASFLSPVD